MNKFERHSGRALMLKLPNEDGTNDEFKLSIKNKDAPTFLNIADGIGKKTILLTDVMDFMKVCIRNENSEINDEILDSFVVINYGAIAEVLFKLENIGVDTEKLNKIMELRERRARFNETKNN